MTGASHEEAREFARSFSTFLDWIGANRFDSAERNPVVALVQDFLGETGRAHSVVSRNLAPFEHVNLQTALDHWQAETGRSCEVHGITIPPHYGGVRLQQLVGGEAMPPLRLSAPAYVDLANGPGSTLACFVLAALLVEDARGRYVVLVIGPSEHEHGVIVEIAGLPVDRAQEVHAELDRLRSRLNVYRGHVLDVGLSPMGTISLAFLEPPQTPRDDVILPDVALERIERHALGVAEHREALQRLGQHVKRGLLLFGPPGTGKTHTTRYLVGRMDGYTRLVLTGRSLHVVGAAAELARELQPSAMVLEDVDLVAEDRGFGPGSNPVLFDLLDAMDGAAPDADLLFLLTTNRADLLEPALAARPGRVDVAVEIALPDADARRRLFTLYSRAVPVELTEAEVDDIVERSDGVTASFLKELVRRSVLESLREETPLRSVTAAHVGRALEDLLDSAQQVTRSLLGVGNDPESLPPGGGAGSLPRRPGGGFFAFPGRPPRPTRYRG